MYLCQYQVTLSLIETADKEEALIGLCLIDPSLAGVVADEFIVRPLQLVL